MNKITLIAKGQVPRCVECGRTFTAPQQYIRFLIDREKVICKSQCCTYVWDVLGIRHKFPIPREV